MSGKLYRYYVTHDLGNFHIALIFISIALLLTSKFTRNTDFAAAGWWVFIFCIISFLVHLNQSRLYRYMTVNREVSYLPARQIRIMNGLFLGFFVIAALSLMILLPRIPYSDIAAAIGNFIRRVIGAILGLFFRDEGHGSGVIATPDINYETGLPDARQDTWLDMLIAVIEKVMEIAAVIVMLVIAFMVLSWLYRKITGGRDSTGTDEHEFIRAEARRERVSRKKETSGAPGLFSRSPADRIRRKYMQAVTRGISQTGSGRRRAVSSLNKMTPAEIEAAAGISGSEKTDYLHRYYEFARYSGGEVTAADVEDLNKMMARR